MVVGFASDVGADEVSSAVLVAIMTSAIGAVGSGLAVTISVVFTVSTIVGVIVPVGVVVLNSLPENSIPESFDNIQPDWLPPESMPDRHKVALIIPYVHARPF